ncbi:hypothetical protein WA026_009997 [Henosepilachna vigintioctopunctata]|uniref:Uncharacterized protein n=1 Tax=Henosepilachna vigintioctopunctata TaxID=420089 RepID=A0AAW1TKL6_9CUCU
MDDNVLIPEELNDDDIVAMCSSLYTEEEDCEETPGENRALRLKEGITLPSQYDEVGLVPGGQLPLQGSAETTDGRLTWNYFDEEGYVSRAGLRQGEDPYIRNRFNQEASDNLPSNREIPDTRNPM